MRRCKILTPLYGTESLSAQDAAVFVVRMTALAGRQGRALPHHSALYNCASGGGRAGAYVLRAGTVCVSSASWVLLVNEPILLLTPTRQRRTR
jgi:hypothetical protein